MKNHFKHYYQPDEDNLKEILGSAMVVLDTNVLLDFYSFGKKTLDDYYNVLNLYKDNKQLWLPHQVGLEFFENRIGIIAKQLNQYDNILGYLENAKNKISDLSNSSPSHSHLDFSEISQDYASMVSPLIKKIQKLQKNHPDYLVKDEVLNELEKIYDDNLVGEEYDEKKTDDIIADGEKRYEKKIPPGYEDRDKKESEKEPSRNRKYGDLILWFQIIDQAKKQKKPVVLVTNDSKEDWVQTAKGERKLGAKPALKKEMLVSAGVDFVLLSSDEFLDKSRILLGLNLNEDSVNEVKKYRELANVRVESMSASTTDFGQQRLFVDEELQYYVEKLTRLINRTVLYLDDIEVPQRLKYTLHEMTYVSKRIRSSVIHHRQIDESYLYDIRKLANRALHINADNDLRLSDSLREIDHFIGKIASRIFGS